MMPALTLHKSRSLILSLSLSLSYLPASGARAQEAQIAAPRAGLNFTPNGQAFNHDGRTNATMALDGVLIAPDTRKDPPQAPAVTEQQGIRPAAGTAITKPLVRPPPRPELPDQTSGDQIPVFWPEDFCSGFNLAPAKPGLSAECLMLEQFAYDQIRSGWESWHEELRHTCTQAATLRGGSYVAMAGCLGPTGGQGSAFRFRY